jgi:hypothetical protein
MSRPSPQSQGCSTEGSQVELVCCMDPGLRYPSFRLAMGATVAFEIVWYLLHRTNAVALR